MYDDRAGRVRLVGGLVLAVAGFAVFGVALVVLGPLPGTIGEFALRWGMRGLAALMVFGGLWLAWTGWQRRR